MKRKTYNWQSDCKEPKIIQVKIIIVNKIDKTVLVVVEVN